MLVDVTARYIPQTKEIKKIRLELGHIRSEPVRPQTPQLVQFSFVQTYFVTYDRSDIQKKTTV